MIFFDAIKTCCNKYAIFTGRARRSEYWFWVLFLFIVGRILNVVGAPDDMYPHFLDIWHIWLYSNKSLNIFSLVTLLPSLAVSVRRLHDIGKSGWNLLWGFLPIIGWIVLLVYFCTDSQQSNKWGKNPKEIDF